MQQPAYTALSENTIFFRPPSLGDLDSIYAIESDGYPEDEAAKRETLEFRIRNAPEAFLVAVRPGSSGGGDAVVGYACGTRTSAPRLTHASMSEHDAAGATLCVHSVAVARASWRRGVASRLLAAYLAYVSAAAPGVTQVRLICKAPLIALYERAGFQRVGASDVVHGADPWFEMAASLDGGSGGGGGDS